MSLNRKAMDRITEIVYFRNIKVYINHSHMVMVLMLLRHWSLPLSLVLVVQAVLISCVGCPLDVATAPLDPLAVVLFFLWSAFMVLSSEGSSVKGLSRLVERPCLRV